MSAGNLFGSDSVLAVDVINGVLRISIGIKTLAHACERNEDLSQHDPEAQDCFPRFTVCNPAKFAKDVKLALLDEAEDGSTPVTRILDAACVKAIENGSEGVEEVQR